MDLEEYKLSLARAVAWVMSGVSGLLDGEDIDG